MFVHPLVCRVPATAASVREASLQPSSFRPRPVRTPAKGSAPPVATATRTAVKSAASDYTARHLQVLEGLEAVRKRPGMYIGSTDSRGLMHCL